MVWIADRGFASAANRAYLTRGGGHYIHAEKLCATNTEAALARHRSVAGNLSRKSRPSPGVTVTVGHAQRGSWSATTLSRPNVTLRSKPTRLRTTPSSFCRLGRLHRRRRDELVGTLKTKPAPHAGGLLRVDAAAAEREAHLDGKWLLRTAITR